MASKKRLRAAIVGFGGMGRRHFKAYAMSPCDVVAICDWQPERVVDFAPEFPQTHIYRDVRQLLDAETDLDIISIASNSPTHAEIAIAALDRGIRRVMVEKPIATTIRDAQAVADCAARMNARVTVNHVRRWSADYERLKALIAEGVIGRLRHVYFTSGSTGLGNFVTHAFDQMRLFFETEAVEATGWIDRTGTINPRGAQFVDPGGFGIVRFVGGQRGFVDASEDTGVQYVFNFVGEYGRIVVDELNNVWTIRARTPDTRSVPFVRYDTSMAIVPFELSEPYDIVTLTGRALTELADDGPLRCSVLDGLRALELVVAFHESHEAGHVPVSLPLAGTARDREVRIA